MKRRKKIYYVSGMISLIFVPLLFWIYSKPTVERLNLRVLDLGLPVKVKKGEKNSKNAIIPMDGWNYKSVNVKPTFGKNDESYFKSLIEKMKRENIEKSGIKFKFNNENTYGDLVKILNLMLKTNQEVYGLDLDKTNSLYVLYQNPNLINEYPIYNDTYDYEYGSQTEYDYQNSSFWKKLIEFSPKQTYYLIFGYLILLYFSMLKPKLTFKI